ncbi:NAD(+)--rifampin ADP-ribosyltransferase [Trichocoleus sp. FACHB-262]|uniref:NAD(+)--rifampin ADP-ribosyltransferase n=1 Tax=Trichocoleus sp. FACHB-262 TaxID=2692869 RepID=UPI00168440DE|nr:NAD(+)--rifampin ADP-ribosyltransferase [Trichocoleus sp. FACHB-262]MBD2122200.1 NAD(+)--rifampin ADP-ribosyltransferase [Trichocoleus sp. FACHB-262]
MSNPETPSTPADTRSRRFYHGTRADLKPGDLIQPGYAKKYPGNPTKSYRSREPLRVVSEYLDWQGHFPGVIQAMKDRIAGLEPIDD